MVKKRKPSRTKTARKTPARKPAAKRKAVRAARPTPRPPKLVLEPERRRRYVPSMGDLLYPSGQPEIDPDFPDAPADWSRGRAEGAAQALGLALTAEICEVIRVLQGCYKDEVAPRLRLLHDALQARFAAQGGMKYLYGVLPGGPIVQGCHLAGLRPPAGARDQSFGSVA